MPLNNGMLNPANTAYSVSSQGNPAQAIHHHRHSYKLVMKVSDMIGVSGKPESSHFMSATHCMWLAGKLFRIHELFVCCNV